MRLSWEYCRNILNINLDYGIIIYKMGSMKTIG